MSLSKETISFLGKECLPSLSGKKVLITGANSGVGFKTAETLVYLGAEVILACRNLEKAEQAKRQLLIEYPDAVISIQKLDLADFDSIDAFAENLPDVDVFVNNAGVLHQPGKKTKQGYNLVMGTNYLGTYRLSEKVIPKLKDCGHEVIFINTISIIHKIAKINYKHFLDDRGSYGRSKIALARYTNSLVERCEGSNIHVLMNHPGMAVTPIAAHMVGFLYRFARYFPINSAEMSALSVAWIMSHDVPDGSVIGPNRGFGGWGYPEINKPCKRAETGIKELLDFTETLTAKL